MKIACNIPEACLLLFVCKKVSSNYYTFHILIIIIINFHEFLLLLKLLLYITNLKRKAQNLNKFKFKYCCSILKLDTSVEDLTLKAPGKKNNDNFKEVI